MSKIISSTVLVLALCSSGCGAAAAPASAPVAEASQPSAPSSSPEASSATNAASSSSSSTSAPAAPVVPSRNTIHLMNRCSHPVGLKIVRSGSTLETSLGSSTGTDQRIDNGEGVALLDDGKKILETITVTPEMTEIEISADCRKLSSR